MIEEIDYLKIAKKNADHADKPGSEDVDSAALIAIGAALIAKIEDDREWRETILRIGLPVWSVEP